MEENANAGSSILVTHPQVAAEAYGWNPETVTAGSGKKVNWQCASGHIWEASPNMRTSRNPPTRCPVCTFRKVSPGVNDLKTTDPDIASTLVDVNPEAITRISRVLVNWRCEKGHEWQASVSNRVGVNKPNRKPIGCPYCGGREVLAGFNDLATTHPHVAEEAHGWDPSKFTFGSHKVVSWQCASGHKWNVSINSRTNNKSGCPYCSGSRVVKGKSDLKTKFPRIASEAHGWDPSEVTASSRTVMAWECANGHIFKMAIGNRTGQGQGCPYCSGKKVLAGFNDLQTAFPEVALQAHNWDPTTLTWGSHKFGDWICSDRHTWRAVVANRTVLGQGCPVCSGRQLLVGFNDLATKFPEIAAQAHGWNPTEVASGTSKRYEWICSRGHIWDATVINRTFNSSGCPVCENQKVQPGFNDLATTHPELAEEAHGWDSTSLTAGSGKKVGWQCRKGHTWEATVASRSGLGQGCPSCAGSGFDPNKPGWLYLLEHPEWGLNQIGISNVLEKRLIVHRRLGWEILDLRGPLPGDVTREWEQAIIRTLKRLGAEFSAEASIGKFTGFTESWTIASFQAKKIFDLMQQVEAMGE